MTFGCLLGLCLATDTPLKALAFFFLFFPLVLRVSPNFYRTGITYLCALAAILLPPLPHGGETGFFGAYGRRFAAPAFEPGKARKAADPLPLAGRTLALGALGRRQPAPPYATITPCLWA